MKDAIREPATAARWPRRFAEPGLRAGAAGRQDPGTAQVRPLSCVQRAALAAGLLGLLALKIAFVLTLAVNSDEPQHLHVIWGWTAGQIPYRDFFDNHAPLFQLLWAPLLALFGERADIVVWMRLTVLPLYAASLWLTWRIAHTLWSRDVAFAALALVAVGGPFFVVSTQFRPDDLWATLWLATVYLIIGGALDARRGAAAGLLAGATLATSLKAVLLLASAGTAALLLAVALASSGRRPQIPWGFLAAFLGALLLVPGVFAVFFVVNGAGPAMLYALFGHNMVGDLGRWQHFEPRFVLAPLTLPLVVWIAWLTRPRDGDLVPWARRCFVLLAASGYLVAIYGYWPLFTRQDLLPSLPFVAIAIAVLLLRTGLASHPLPWLRGAALAILLLVELATVLDGHRFRQPAYAAFERRLAKVLALTRTHDYVMDAKGEAIFRRRPVYWVLEGITLARMREGNIEDDIAVRLAETATPVVIADRLPDTDQRFVDANYLDLGDQVRIAGLRIPDASAGMARRFEIAVPLRYAIVTRAGAAPQATIDGHACAPDCALAAGTHTLLPARDGEVVLAWATALTRGVVPAALLTPPAGDRAALERSGSQ